MFGYARPNRKQLSPEANGLLTASYCGLCARLRASYGQWACLLAGYDALFPVLLVASQTVEPPALGPATRCPYCAGLRAIPTLANMQALDYGAAITGLLVAERIDDWQRDGLSAARLLRGADRRLESRATGMLRNLGFDPAPLAAWRERQAEVEAKGDLPLDEALAPSGEVLSVILVGAARLAGCEDASAPFQAVGQAVGRLVALADACEDLSRDRQTRSFNPLLDETLHVPGPLPISFFVRACQAVGAEMAALRRAQQSLTIAWLPELVNNVLCQGLPHRVGLAVLRLWSRNHWQSGDELRISRSSLRRNYCPNTWFWDDLAQAPTLAAELGYRSTEAYVLARVLALP